jgi:hypothetical protein
VLLVPRQLRRYGMTGDVPYYGGRLTPAQTYAITHPRRPPGPPVPDPAEAARTLQELLDTGVITEEEFDLLKARIDR